MQQIADWLEKLGMSEYVQHFAENRIDFSVLRELTDQDLKDLAVVLGDRRKMLRAIADIEVVERNAPAVPAKATAAPRRTPVASAPIPTATPQPTSAAAEVSGERRFITVMFCDLVGSTSIAAQLDAEEWRDLVSLFFDAACATVTEMGDPVARKLTARVQHQVAGLFVIEERGSCELKGVSEPVTLYRLVRASGAGRRGRQRRPTPLVGREEEVAMLMRRWERAQQGDGQLVMIVGEPGLARNRRAHSFRLGPVLRAKRTLCRHAKLVAFDAEPTSPACVAHLAPGSCASCRVCIVDLPTAHYGWRAAE
jgi:hypothetical protein